MEGLVRAEWREGTPPRDKTPASNLCGIVRIDRAEPINTLLWRGEKGICDDDKVKLNPKDRPQVVPFRGDTQKLAMITHRTSAIRLKSGPTQVHNLTHNRNLNLPRLNLNAPNPDAQPF